MEVLAKRIRQLRRERKLRQYQWAMVLSDTCGEYVSPSIESAWERGVCEPSMRKLCAIAQYFNVSTDYLLGLTERRQS